MYNLINGLILVLLAVAVLVVLAAATLGGKLSAETRRRVELGMALVFFPVVVAQLIWRAAGLMAAGDKLAALGAVAFAFFIAWSGVRIIWARRKRLAEGSAAS
ncbi:MULTISPECIES: NnrU family protein [Brevundimonas]|uniref:NnrU family protein n=1 Tax=Brevundimonas TaxID=41275 RepID=UPI00257CE896|nr:MULTISPECIES: NnrU family protein [Brevundimonas]